MAGRMLGFDFGDYEMKIAVCRDRQIQRFVTVQMPDNIVQGGRIVSFHAMADLIRETVKKEHLSGKAAVSLPMDACFLRRVRLPRMTVSQLKVNLPFEFHDYIATEPGEYVYDYAVLETSQEGMELMAAAISRRVMQQYKEMMKRAGLKLVKLVPEVLGIQSILIPKDQERMSQDYAVLDMGHEGTRLYFYSHGAYEITHTMENGGRQAARLVAEEKGVDVHIAQLYLKENHDNVLDLPQVADLFEGIATEIMRDMNFYSYNNPQNSIDCIYYTGSGLNAQRFTGLVAQTTGLRLIPLTEKIPGAERFPELIKGPQAYGVVTE